MKTYAFYIVFSYDKFVTEGKERKLRSSMGTQEIITSSLILTAEDVYSLAEEIRKDRDCARVIITSWHEMSAPSEAAMKHSPLLQTDSEDEKVPEGCQGVEELKPTGGEEHKSSRESSIKSDSQDEIKSQILGDEEERAKEGTLPLMTGDEVKYRLGVLSGVEDRELFLYLGEDFSGLFQLYEGEYYSINNKGILTAPTVFNGDPQVYNFGEICREGFRSVIYITVLDLMEKA